MCCFLLVLSHSKNQAQDFMKRLLICSLKTNECYKNGYFAFWWKLKNPSKDSMPLKEMTMNFKLCGELPFVA